MEFLRIGSRMPFRLIAERDSATRKQIGGSRYRVVVNNYLASGGEGLSSFTTGTDITDRNIIDLDALVAWIGPGRTPPAPNRIRLIH